MLSISANSAAIEGVFPAAGKIIFEKCTAFFNFFVLINKIIITILYIKMNVYLPVCLNVIND